jgi:organic hydroperoxide reductase OsmC/OhrA
VTVNMVAKSFCEETLYTTGGLGRLYRGGFPGAPQPLPVLRRMEEGDNTMTTEEALRFRVIAWWASGRTGIAKSSSAPNAIHFTSPPAFGGLEGRWTPEDLLLCAVASCYTTTFRALADNSKLVYTDLQVEVESAIRKADNGYNFGEVLIRANLTIPHEEERERAIKLLYKAKEKCLVSRALSVEQTFEPRVQAGAPRAEVGQPLPVSGKEGYR